MYVSSKLNFKVIAENTLNANCEDIWVCVKNIKTFKKILVASIYRHTSSDTANFVQVLNNKIVIWIFRITMLICLETSILTFP